MTYQFAVIGQPVAHSLSPVIHQAFAEQFHIQLNYEKIEAEMVTFEQQVNDFFKAGGKGLNITLPFKQMAFMLAKKHSERCQAAKAANTLWFEDGRIAADNTDGIGLINDISRYVQLENKTILLLGAGGAARGILWPLINAQPKKIDFRFVTIGTVPFEGTRARPTLSRP